MEYQYDAYQNVTLRDDRVNEITEEFEYDRLDRLTATTVHSKRFTSSQFNSTQSQSYDVLGNITRKSDVGNYFYDNMPHAVTRAGSRTYSYDANGNMTSGDGRSIQWSSFNKPTKITRNGKSATFTYGPDNARYRKVNHEGDTTLYVDGIYERLTINNTNRVDQKHYIYANGQLVAEHIVSNKNGTQTRYMHRDALDSIDLITDSFANVVDRRSFDPWGKLRDLPWQQDESILNPLFLTQLPFTNKGYTGHEHIEEVDLIHMNGRVYDATLGRFLSADSFIQAGGMSQNYNRYSYVLNNPMKYNDPSGHFFDAIGDALGDLFDAIRPFAGIIIGVALKKKCGPCGALVIKAVSGGVGAGLNGGNILEGAVLGAVTAGLASEIGAASNIFGKASNFDIGRAIAHGVVGGTINVVRGGQFGVGFASSAFTKLASGGIQELSGTLQNASEGLQTVVGATTAAIVGGTVSVIGGGKFANGAATAAIQYLYNQADLDNRRASNRSCAGRPCVDRGNSSELTTDRGIQLGVGMGEVLVGLAALPSCPTIAGCAAAVGTIGLGARDIAEALRGSDPIVDGLTAAGLDPVGAQGAALTLDLGTAVLGAGPGLVKLATKQKTFTSAAVDVTLTVGGGNDFVNDLNELVDENGPRN